MSSMLTARLTTGDRRFALVSGRHVIGSGSDVDLQIEHPTVSRRHAEIEASDDGLRVRDLESSNGTLVNGAPVDSWTMLKAGDELRFGQVLGHISALSEDDAQAEVPADEPVDTRPGRSEATLATGTVARFFAAELRDLLEGLAADTAEFPAHLAVALERQVCQGVRIEQDEAVVADAGTSDASSNCVRTMGPWRIEVSGYESQREPALPELLDVSLQLLDLADRSRPGSLRTKPRDRGDMSRHVPKPPDPPTGHGGLAETYRQAARIASGRISVLIEGESGTGKELLARYIHDAGGAKTGPLVVLNCASLPRDLLETELFGIEKGVATGVEPRAGKFELAHGGTLMLDEIGDMALETQAKILRVLQEREVFRVGGQRARPAELRVISATNRPMRTLVDEGEFRLDLYHRITDWTVRLPPLRERRMDIANLAAHFLRRGCSRAGSSFGGISKAAVDALKGYSWPGNVRELEREMARCALFLESGEMLTSKLLQTRIRESDAMGGKGLDAILARAEREAVINALAANQGNVREAARTLEIGLSTMYRRIREFDIDT